MSKKDKKEIVWFGMKLTPEEKQKIEFLAKKKGISQKEVVMNLVKEDVLQFEVEPAPGSLLEKIQDHVGVFDGPDDLSTNPKHFDDFGKDNIH